MNLLSSKLGLAGVLLSAFVFPLFAIILLKLYIPNLLFKHQISHGIMEALGSFAAFTLAALLLIQMKAGAEVNHRLWLAVGFIGMGILDLFHAFTQPGNTFVWLHSTATFIGGLFFAMVWLPSRITRSAWTGFCPWAVILVSVILGIISIVLPEYMPVMVRQGVFTPVARMINISGGFFFLFSACYFVIRYRKNEGGDELLFATLSVLFGLAGILFETSMLWGASWWLWHFMRLVSYFVALIFGFVIFQRNQNKIVELNRALKLQMKLIETQKDELERSNQELDDFAYIASHDLKEPLRGISSFTSFIMQDYGDKLDDAGRSKLETLKKLCSRLEDFIDNLLRYSRVGRTELSIKETDLNIVVNEISDRLKIRLDENKINIKMKKPLPNIKCDRIRVGEIFTNLISNALKYNNKEDKQIEIGYVEDKSKNDCIKSSLKEDLAYPIFYVRDNGIGIKEEYLDRIFTIFKRLHGRDKYGGGTGAGLAIAKKIVERHNGSIWAESVLNQGTTFYFNLPGGENAN